MRVGQEDQYVGISNVSYSGSAITVRITSDRVYVKAVSPGKATFRISIHWDSLSSTILRSPDSST
ncbi:hypothetical protein PO124_24425 [Bacillus licheniformis]|nr:hypothetical protein [Bacillus licheniformis]